MEKRAWKALLKPGMKAEYIKRHDEIWPEMTEVLKAAGICNYTIWNIGDELFGYYECEKGVAYAEKVQAESPVVARWNVHMAGLMDMVRDETGAAARLENVFMLD
ncbi:MAG TPA: L-rhamnose mutarotase [Candidatus Limiplasma sp.]|nr:L-rhamnose mutarotase [Candidatus Limiplasma sp.]HRX08498.1 L-rhamnose mutarotase [Candidatus Limiplasma sp.]